MSRLPSLRSVMTPFPWFVDAHADLGRAEAMMQEHGIRHLPVVEDGKLLGVVSDRDLARARTAQGRDGSDELAVGDAFVERAYMVDDSVPLDQVLDHLWAHRIGSALVLHAGELVGILTAMDACRLLAACLRGERLGPPPGPA